MIKLLRSRHRTSFQRGWQRFGFPKTCLEPVQSIQDRKCQIIRFAMQNHRTLSKKSRTVCNKYNHCKCCFNQICCIVVQN